ncbi:MAG: SRPBCC family protein, partial [Gammaproteobacteria bacterium]|nr:SRPBCC family protein [Gammaproteobacteria bacterium]
MTEKIHITKSINAPSEKVWAAISAIGGLDKWFPIIAACEVNGSGVGAKRICTMPDGAKMHETIEEIDHDAMRFRYAINESPMPISNYMGTVEMKAAGDAT